MVVWAWMEERKGLNGSLEMLSFLRPSHHLPASILGQTISCGLVRMEGMERQPQERSLFQLLLPAWSFTWMLEQRISRGKTYPYHHYQDVTAPWMTVSLFCWPSIHREEIGCDSGGSSIPFPILSTVDGHNETRTSWTLPSIRDLRKRQEMDSERRAMILGIINPLFSWDPGSWMCNLMSVNPFPCHQPNPSKERKGKRTRLMAEEGNDCSHLQARRRKKGL